MKASSWIPAAAWVITGCLLVQFAFQMWGIGRYWLASRHAKSVEVEISRFEYAYDSSMGSSTRVVTVHYLRREQPDRPLNTISYSCPERCAMDKVLEQLQLGSLDQLVGKSYNASMLVNGEVHLHLLTVAEISWLILIALAFKVVQLGGVWMFVNRAKERGDQQ